MKIELASFSILFSLFSSVASSSEPVASAVPCSTCPDEGNLIPSQTANPQASTTNDDSLYGNESEQSSDIYLGSTHEDQDSGADISPWSYEPICTEFLEGLKSKLCVYTNATFANGRGISIFTTPEIAKEFATLLPFQDPSVLQERAINPPDGPWYTRKLPGKGIGMLAKRNLKRGDVITAYTPYLLAHMENVLSTQEREEYLRIAVDQLPDASKEHYFSLATIYGKPSVIVQDVVKTNTFEMQVGGQMHMAVFPEAARMNHACAPKYECV